jgi:hypothetical protein
LRALAPPGTLLIVTEPVIYREEVVRLLFTLYDMSEAIEDIRDVLVEDEGGSEEDEG